MVIFLGGFGEEFRNSPGHTLVMQHSNGPKILATGWTIYGQPGIPLYIYILPCDWVILNSQIKMIRQNI